MFSGLRGATRFVVRIEQEFRYERCPATKNGKTLDNLVNAIHTENCLLEASSQTAVCHSTDILPLKITKAPLTCLYSPEAMQRRVEALVQGLVSR